MALLIWIILILVSVDDVIVVLFSLSIDFSSHCLSQIDQNFVAKEVLKRKFLVGLLDNKRGSFARFDHYFKWKESPKYASEFGCRKQLMDEKYTPKNPVRKGSETWNLLMEQNRFDIHLYDYAKELFVQQSFIFGL